MGKKIEEALQSALMQSGKIRGYDPAPVLDKMYAVFGSDAPLLDKAARLDVLIDAQPEMEPLREVLFDLLLINFFSRDLLRLEEEYLESREWEEIEEKTLDRGTEILNLLLYLKECDDEGITPELNDYLNEFLLVNDDEFQDEYRIYEDVISNQVLTDSSFESIAAVAGKLDESSEMKLLFYPVLSFFYNPEPDENEMSRFIKYSINPDFDSPVYALLTTYNRAK